MNEKDGSAHIKRQADSRKKAIAQNNAVFEGMDRRAAENFFAKRGFSAPTVKALIDHGLKLPEELLMMTESEVGSIAGLGKEGVTEVRAYRERFLIPPR